MRELIVVRHGESEGNAQRIAQGPLPYPLTPRGREQAAAVAERIARMGWQPERIVTSPVRRCVDTAAILAEKLSLAPATEAAAFTEIDCGSATGKPFAELAREHPDFFRRPASEWGDFDQIGGESAEALRARVGAGLDALDPEARLVVVTHGAVFKATLNHLMGLRATYFLDIRNTTILRLDRRRVGATDVIAWSHLLHADEP